MINYPIFNYIIPFGFFEIILNISTIILTIVGTISEIVKSKRQSIRISLLFWLPFFILYFISFFKPILYVRYICFLAPFMTILTFKGIKYLSNKKLFHYICVFFLFLLNLRIYLFLYIPHNISKPNYREMVEYIEQNYNENDGVIHMDAKSFYSYEYYSENKSTIYDPIYETPFYVGRVMLTDQDYSRNLSDLAKYDRLWIIDIHEKETKSDFEELFDLKEEKEFKGELYLQLWEKVNSL